MRFALRWPLVVDRQQQEVNEDLLAAVNAVGLHIEAGSGVPSSSPAGPALYFRQDGGVGTSAYGWDGTSWTALW